MLEVLCSTQDQKGGEAVLLEGMCIVMFLPSSERHFTGSNENPLIEGINGVTMVIVEVKKKNYVVFKFS